MIAYAETNFVLELVLEQEESEACEEILSLARAGTVALALPAYSLIEPVETLRRRHGRRIALARESAEQLKLLRRSTRFSKEILDVDRIGRVFERSTAYESSRLDHIRATLTESARILPLDAGVLR